MDPAEINSEIEVLGRLVAVVLAIAVTVMAVIILRILS
jgi:hypothetical protein